MDGPTDLRLAELLASRLCHDLVGPISAISNGMELLEEGAGELDEEAGRLIGDSAAQAAATLQFFRVAFGFSASPSDEPAELEALIAAFLAHRKASLDWSIPAAPELTPGWGKLLMNMAALASEALPLGGRVEATVASLDGSRQLRCLAIGPEAGLRPEVAAALASEADARLLTPRSVLGFYLVRVAGRLGATVAANGEAADRFAVSVLLPG